MDVRLVHQRDQPVHVKQVRRLWPHQMLRMPSRISSNMAAPIDMCSRWDFCLAVLKKTSPNAKVALMIFLPVLLSIKASNALIGIGQ